MGLRSTAFWIIDRIKGSKVSRYYNEVLQYWHKPNTKGLNLLLEYAVNNTKFYQNCNPKDIDSFPVLTKLDIRNQIDDFISQKHKKSDLIKAVTSGSTGVPLIIYQDSSKKHRNTADTLVFGGKANFTLGQNLFYFKIWNEVNKKSRIRAWMENIHAVDVTQLSDEKIDQFIKQLKKVKGSIHFLGYASSYDAICSYLKRNKIKTNIKIDSAIAMSEALSEYTKKEMKLYFDVDVVSRYSNVENGIIAQQIIGESEFQINRASYLVEVLEMDNNKSVTFGQPGRIVVTDLYNYGMPIIRYDTGDVGSKKSEGILEKIEGRKMDQIFNTNGDLLSSFTITNQMWKYPEIIQYQFIQKSRGGYLFKLNVDKTFVRNKELIDEFKSYLGSDAIINIEIVNEIPLLSSGKRRKVVQEYYK